MKDYVYAIIGIASIFLATTLGSSFVFFFKKDINKTWNQIFVGFAAGVMMAASFFSLLLPAIETEITYMPSFLVAVIGTLAGAMFLWGIDKLIPHFHVNENKDEGLASRSLSKTSKMFLAVTIHNVPEGLSAGIAFGVALGMGGGKAAMMGALMLAIGIAIQNIPEGAAVSLPVKGESGKSGKAFWFGTLSGAVEPIAAIAGLFLAIQIQVIMPWALCFAAGCMIYVVAEEMIPEMKAGGHNHFGVWSFLIGFVLMMALDVSLG